MNHLTILKAIALGAAVFSIAACHDKTVYVPSAQASLNATPVLRETPTSSSQPAGNPVAVADVDGDGDLDIVIAKGGAGNAAEQNRLLLNDGKGYFADATATNMPMVADNTCLILLLDVDGDGDRDLLAGNDGEGAASKNALYLNDGSGKFHTPGVFHNAHGGQVTLQMIALDLDGDGRLDLIEGNTSTALLPGEHQVYINDGGGRFSSDKNRLPVEISGGPLVTVDVDGDGDRDLIVARDRIRLLLNDSHGFFVDAPTFVTHDIPGTTALAAGDFDRDGDQDLLVGRRGFENRLLLNDGHGRFFDHALSPWSSIADDTIGITAVDLDADGDLDVIVDNMAIDRVYLNHGDGKLTHYEHLAVGPSTLTGQMADIDGDGDLDLITSGPIYHNLTRHLFADTEPTIGQVFAIDCVSRPSTTPSAHPTQLMIGLRERMTVHPVFGTLWVDLTSAYLPPVQHTDEATATTRYEIPIPSLPDLVGRKLYAQALVANRLDATTTARSTNVWVGEFH